MAACLCCIHALLLLEAQIPYEVAGVSPGPCGGGGVACRAQAELGAKHLLLGELWLRDSCKSVITHLDDKLAKKGLCCGPTFQHEKSLKMN